MFDWLNSNAGAMQAASALANVLLVCILVGVTAWYAWQTQRMAKEMREQRMDAIRPVIDIHFPDPRTSLERLSEAIGEEESVVRDRYTVRLRNIGSGCRQRYPHMVGASGAIEVTGGNDDAAIGEPANTFPARLTTRYP